MSEENAEEKFDEKTMEKEEKELRVAFNPLTLTYREKKLEKGFSSHIGPHSLLVVEVILSIGSLLLIYVYLPKKLLLSLLFSVVLLVIFLLTLLLVRQHERLLRWWLARHLFASLYLLSPLVLLLVSLDGEQALLPALLLFLSTSLSIGASVSHLVKTFFALLASALFLPLFLVVNPQPGSSLLGLGPGPGRLQVPLRSFQRRRPWSCWRACRSACWWCTASAGRWRCRVASSTTSCTSRRSSATRWRRSVNAPCGC